MSKAIKRFNTLTIFIIKEKDILDLVEYEFLIDEKVKKELLNLIEVNFNTFVEFLYITLKYYYLPLYKGNETMYNSYQLLENFITEKDKIKVDELMKYVSELNDIYVLDKYDYLYNMSNIDEMSFNTDFYDFIGNYLNSRGIEIDYVDDYFYLLKKIFDIFLLNSLFNIELYEKEENIVFGVNLFSNKNNSMILDKQNSELHLIIFNN